MTESHFSITSYITSYTIIFTVSVQLNNCFQKFICSVSPKIETCDGTVKNRFVYFTQLFFTLWWIRFTMQIYNVTSGICFDYYVGYGVNIFSDKGLKQYSRAIFVYSPVIVQTNRQEFWGVFDNILDLPQFFFLQKFCYCTLFGGISFFVFRIETLCWLWQSLTFF